MRDAIKIGVIADQSGTLSVMGAAQANVATLVVDEMNASGGLLGRRVELIIEDSASDDARAAANATKLVREDHVDVLLGGIFSSTRQAIKSPAVVEVETLYIYPEQYGGQEYHPLVFCTGAADRHDQQFDKRDGVSRRPREAARQLVRCGRPWRLVCRRERPFASHSDSARDLGKCDGPSLSG